MPQPHFIDIAALAEFLRNLKIHLVPRVTETCVVLENALEPGGAMVTPQYTVGKGQVQLWLDGLYAANGTAWEEVGSADEKSASITVKSAVRQGTVVIIRVTT